MITYLPIEIMQQTFKYLDNKSLFSCLFVNKYWYNCAAPSLWENPFKREATKYSYLELLPPALRNSPRNENRFMTVEIYLKCLNKEPLLNYPAYLKQLDYGDLEDTVNLYLTKKFPDKVDDQEEIQFITITKTLFKLILQQSKNLRILTIKTMKYEFPNLQNFSNQQPGLSNLVKVKIDMIQNVKYLLKLISLNCDQIHYFDINLKPSEYFTDIIHYIADIINAQDYLMEFSISFVKSYFDPIMFALLSQKSSLVSIRLYDITFTENSNNLLKEFNHLKDLSLINCDGVDNDTLEIKSIFNRYNVMSRDLYSELKWTAPLPLYTV